MGILDHRRTWQFEVGAPPDTCLDAFVSSLTGKSGLQLLGSRWSVGRSPGANGELRAVATYQGRAGVAGVMTPISRRATAEQSAAKGSQITFHVTGNAAAGRTRCLMKLTRSTTVFLAFTADARFLRSAMNRVVRQLNVVDPGMTLTKN